MKPASPKPLVWLASYPSSGNTWTRALLAALLYRDGAEPDINRLDTIPPSGFRPLLDRFAGVETVDLRWDELQDLRPAVYRAIAGTLEETRFLKIHDRFGATPGGEPLVPVVETKGAIYIVRNPLDVVASFASHFGMPLDEVIRTMADPDFTLSPASKGLHLQVPQTVGSWSGHVESWDQADFPVHPVRYEDLLVTPVDTLRDLVHFAGFSPTREEVARAVEMARFERLQAQETAGGFRERAATTRRFFRQGRAGGWRTELTARQVAAVVRDHGEVMQRFGYLPDQEVAAR